MSRPKSQPIASDERGAILVVVLIFVTVFGLILAGLLSELDANLANTRGVRAHEAKLYAADAGIDYGIQQLQQDNSVCPDPTNPADLPPQVINGRTVQVHCDTTTGTVLGGEGYAVITTSPTDGIQTQGGGSKTIEGPVWANALSNSVSNLVIKNGNLYEHKSATTCSDTSAPTDKPAGVTITPSPPYNYRCTTNPQPVVAHVLPTSVPASHGANPDVTTGSGCRVFRPGKYTSINLGANNYFVSGVYYFENIGMDVGSGHVVAGAMASDETNINGFAACADDTTAPPATGTGVKIILGGSSSITASNPSGTVELFRRNGGDPAAEGTQGISVQAVESGAAAGWAPSTAATLMSVGNGSNPALTIHGLVYAPSSFVDFSATNGSEAQIRGGIVIDHIQLQASASASGLAVSVLTGPGLRESVLTSTAKGVLPGERDLVSTAVVDIDNDEARTITILSWREK